MSRTKITVPVFIVLVALASVLLFLDIHRGIAPKTNYATPKPVCSHYETVKSITSRWSGAWSGEITTITMTDGSSYISGKNSPDEYAGQKICVTDSKNL